MARHYFDPEVAMSVNVKAAVIYQFIVNACKKDATPWTQFHDGEYWVEFPQSRFEDVFPYMSVGTVRNWLNILEKLEYIKSGCFDDYTQTIKSYSPR